MDERFDRLGQRLVKRVWSGPKGKIRRAIILRDLEPVLTKQLSREGFDSTDRRPRLADLGCGPGFLAADLAARGYLVDLCDTSELLLAQAVKALENGDGTSVGGALGEIWQGPFQRAPWERQTHDLVFSHGVLGWLEDPMEALEELWSFVRIGGCLSLLVFNPWRWALRKGKFGQWDALMSLKPDIRKGRKLTPPNAPEPVLIDDWARKRRIPVLARSGVRIFYDSARTPESFDDQGLAAELAFSQKEPFSQIGMHTHWVLEKKN